MMRLASATICSFSLFSRLNGLLVKGCLAFGAKIDALQPFSYSANLDTIASILNRGFVVSVGREVHWYLSPNDVATCDSIAAALTPWASVG